MDKIQKEKIIKLRNEGKSYTVIADELKISRDTVKSFCRRNIAVERPQGNSVLCKNCGQAIIQKDKIKRKVFCSKECREKWWHKNAEKINKKAVYTFNCKYCGKIFSAYGNNHRKYCSRTCYAADRFKGGVASD
ncbi:MAG: RNA polymerase subunit sigma-70 [Firmicutes bacterium]|nr:RNA polymerase subunit sigma-70 [Bacillota bacterium]